MKVLRPRAGSGDAKGSAGPGNGILRQRLPEGPRCRCNQILSPINPGRSLSWIMYLLRYSIAWCNPPLPHPLHCAANAGKSWKNSKPSAVCAAGPSIEQFFVQKREVKTMRQGPFYVLKCHIGSTDYLCICTNNPSPPSE